MVFFQLPLQAQDLLLQLAAGNGVDGPKGLVHQQQPWIPGQRPRQTDPLLLSARQLSRVAVSVLMGGQINQAEQLVHPLADALLRPPQKSRHYRHILGHRHVGKQPRLLDNIADPLPQSRDGKLADIPPVQANLPLGGIQQAIHHFQKGGFAAARRPQDDHQLARLHGKTALLHSRLGTVGKAQRYPLELDGAHLRVSCNRQGYFLRMPASTKKALATSAGSLRLPLTS